MKVEVVPEGFPVYDAARDKFHEVRDGRGVQVDGTMFCTVKDEAAAKAQVAK